MSVSTMIRYMGNFMIYAMSAVFVFIAAFDKPALYVVGAKVGWVLSLLYSLRTLVSLLFVMIGLFADDGDYYNYITNFYEEVAGYF